MESNQTYWEYRIDIVEPEGENRVFYTKSLENRMNYFGWFGWELVSMVPVTCAKGNTLRIYITFKRAHNNAEGNRNQSGFHP